MSKTRIIEVYIGKVKLGEIWKDSIAGWGYERLIDTTFNVGKHPPVYIRNTTEMLAQCQLYFEELLPEECRNYLEYRESK